MNILLCGDSFAADWSIKHRSELGWPNLLASKYNVTNVATAGSSEYRIWKTLQAQNVTLYDCVIVSHTSPYRLYVNKHPVHNADILHKNCDLIYADAVEHNLTTVKDYFDQYFDIAYATDIHQLIVHQIADICKNVQTIHMQHINASIPKEINIIDFSTLWHKHRGKINHYDSIGNQIVYETLLKML